jgi:hypothetical protein
LTEIVTANCQFAPLPIGNNWEAIYNESALNLRIGWNGTVHFKYRVQLRRIGVSRHEVDLIAGRTEVPLTV